MRTNCDIKAICKIFQLSRCLALAIFSGLALSVIAARCQLPQSGSPWQSTQSSSLCQGLSLWERCRGVSRDGEGEDATHEQEFFGRQTRLFRKILLWTAQFPAFAGRKNRTSGKIDTFPCNNGKCLLNNYLSLILAIHTVFVYNSNCTGQRPDCERDSGSEL